MTTSYYGLSVDAPELSTNFGSMTATGPGGTLTQSAANNTGNLDGFYDNIAFTGNFTAQGSMPSGATFAGWVLNAVILQGTTIPAGTWETKVSIHCSDSGAPVGILTVRWWRNNPNANTFVAIGTASSGSTTLANGWNDFDLSASIGSVSFAAGTEFTGDTLYVDFIWEQTAGGDSATDIALGVSSTSTGVAGGSSTHGMEVIVPASAGSDDLSGTDTILLGDSGTLSTSVSLSGTDAILLEDVGLFGNYDELTGSDAIALGDTAVLSIVLPLPSIPPAVMPIISQGAPAYSNMTSYPPSNADDVHYGTLWRSAAVPSTGSPCDLIYDLSHVSSTQRALVVVNLLNELGNWRPALDGNTQSALMNNYTLDANAAAGGPNSQPGYPYSGYPTTGWVNLVTVTGNDYPTRQHIINLTGYNWLRFRCTASLPDTADVNTDVLLQMDVHDAHLGAQDRWLFVGDSITEEGMIHAGLGGGDWGPAIPGAVCQIANTDTFGTYYPATIDGGNFGWKTSDVIGDITDYFNGFTGGFVSLSLGTNDVNQTFAFSPGDSNVTGIYANFKTLINYALALNNIVIIPKIPYGDGGNGHIGNNANLVNEYLASQLPTDYPSQFNASLFIGPDFWTFFSNNPQLLRSDGIHPTYIEVSGAASGYEEMHSLWGAWMNQYIYQVSPRPAVHTLSDSPVAVHTLSDSIVE